MIRLLNFLKWAIIIQLVVTNFLRFYIFINGYLRIGRLPLFTDGLDYRKAVLISWQTDEVILLIGHFINPIIILIGFIILYPLRHSNTFFKFLTALIVFFIVEIVFQLSPFYEYIIFD